MYLFNYQYLKNKETFVLILLILFSILIRIPIILIFGDTSLEYEWKILVNNLIVHKTLAFDYLDPSLDKFLLPNIWMPPLYAYYLYFLSFFNLEEQNYLRLILSSQIILASLSVIIFYKINKNFFSKKISFFSSSLFSLFPLNLYICSQISSVTLQVFFTLLFFYFFFKFIRKQNLGSMFALAFMGGLLLLLRGEFIAILLISFFYLFIFFKIKIKKILLITLITLITISPYLIRNVSVFETFALTKSFGFNLWKGNNSNTTIEGGGLFDEDLRKKISDIPKDRFYGINFDKIFLDRAIKNITDEPLRYLNLFLKKATSFLFIDINSTQPYYYHPLHYVPVLLIGILSIIGIILSEKKSYKLNYLILIYFVNIIIFSCFFILPRYKLIILPLQIIFTNILIDYVAKKYFIKTN